MHYDSRYPRHSDPEGRRYGRRVEAHLDDRTGVGPGSPGGYEPDEPRARYPERGFGARRFAKGYAEDQSFDPREGQVAEFGDEDYDFERERMDRDERRQRSRYYRGADFGGGRPRAADMRDNDYRRAMEESDYGAGRYQAYPFNPYDAWWGVGPGFGFGRDLRDGRVHEPHVRRGWQADRGFWDKASDEVASWFGDDEAEHRRDMDKGEHEGRGPRGYKRSDARIQEDISDRLARDSWLDASGIEVKVNDCEVTLDGSVESRADKRRAELWAETVMGVDHVQNNLRVDRNLAWSSRPRYDEGVGESAVSPVGEYATIAKQTRGNA
jgi:hypothetical protein